MSWIFGCLSENLNEDDSRKFQSIHDDPIHMFKTTSLYISAGGNKKTTFAAKNLNQNNFDFNGWLVSGVGLISEDQNKKIMSAEDWAKLLESDSFDPSKINGHFVVVKWTNDNSIKIYNDLIGIRTIYLFKQRNRIIFSTELTWIIKFVNNPAINIKAFGSRWLTFNQLSYKCLINGIEKLAPGGIIEIRHDQITVENKNWIPRKIESTSESFTNSLIPFLSPKSYSNLPITLGLSGGLDSRTLLSLYSARENINDKNKFIHTFGESQDPDVKVAKIICSHFDFNYKVFSDDCYWNTNMLNVMKEYAGDALLVEPVSGILKNNYLNDTYFQNKIIIDGAGGEIARKQFLNRLRLKGKRNVLNKNLAGVLKNIFIIRSDIFSPDVMREMKNGCLKDIENLLFTIPEAGKIGFENFIDLMAIKYRFPNYYGPEQSRLDKTIVSFSPFVQHTVLQQIFSLNVNLKKNSVLFHKIIRNWQPRLRQFPLVKDGVTYPYGMSNISASIYTKIKKRLLINNTSAPKNRFFDSLKEYINDLILSSELKHFALYDCKKINGIVEQYYAGKKSLQNQLDWFLTFELWRRAHRIT